MPKRLLYYNCRNYVQQLVEGQGYHHLHPAISICVLDKVLFPQQERYHLSFRLRCDQADLVLVDDLEFHTLELPKFHPSSNNVSGLPREQKWLYLLRNAKTMEADALSNLIGDPEYREALGVLDLISKSPEDRQQYEDRVKFRRDADARLEYATQQGIEKGHTEGLLAGKIQVLQELLGDPPTPGEELLSKPIAELSDLSAQLRLRLDSRNG